MTVPLHYIASLIVFYVSEQQFVWYLCYLLPSSSTASLFFFLAFPTSSLSPNVSRMEYGVEHLECWAPVWEQASCLCSAYSLQPKTEKERAKQQPQVWPVCRMPGLLSGWQPPTHQGYAAVIRWEEMLEIPNSSDRAHVTWNEESESLLQFAYVMLDLEDDSPQVLVSGWDLLVKLRNALPGVEWGGLTQTSCEHSLSQIWTFSVVWETQHLHLLVADCSFFKKTLLLSGANSIRIQQWLGFRAFRSFLSKCLCHMYQFEMIVTRSLL